MFVALRLERRRMPAGMVRQNAIGCPTTRGATPARRRWAAADRPYGPAPSITTSSRGMAIEPLPDDPAGHRRAATQRRGEPALEPLPAPDGGPPAPTPGEH